MERDALGDPLVLEGRIHPRHPPGINLFPGDGDRGLDPLAGKQVPEKNRFPCFRHFPVELEQVAPRDASHNLGAFALISPEGWDLCQPDGLILRHPVPLGSPPEATNNSGNVMLDRLLTDTAGD